MTDSVPAIDWAGRAAHARLPGQMIIGGELRSGSERGDFGLVSPRDGHEIAKVPNGGPADVDAAVAAARRAFEDSGWSRMTPAARKTVLHRLADLIEAHRDELALLISLEMGKPVTIAAQVEMRTTISCYRWYAEWADKLAGEMPDVGPGAVAQISREPVGVVGVVVPWNFPMTLSAWKIAPALAVGCTIVVKPSESSPLSMLRIGELALEAGLPSGVLNVVTGDGPETARALGLHPDVDTIAFTGSGPAGRHFLRYAADSNIKRVWLELGGKSPSIILPDADLEAAAAATAKNIFFNSGQMCTAPSRLLVHGSVREEVVARVTAAAAAQRVGDPLRPETQMGPLISSQHRQRVEQCMRDAVTAGASMRYGGTRPDGIGADWYFQPTVLDDVSPAMRIARQEVFGPVLSVLSYRSVDEAVALANDSDYGLAAAAWSRDVSAAHAVSRRLRAGTVWVNCYEEGDMTVPFGGYKQSGNGRDKSVHALEKYTELKTTWIQL